MLPIPPNNLTQLLYHNFVLIHSGIAPKHNKKKLDLIIIKEDILDNGYPISRANLSPGLAFD